MACIHAFFIKYPCRTDDSFMQGFCFYGLCQFCQRLQAAFFTPWGLTPAGYASGKITPGFYSGRLLMEGVDTAADQQKGKAEIHPHHGNHDRPDISVSTEFV